MEGPEIKAVEDVIDYGSFGTRTLRFESRLSIRPGVSPAG